MSAWYLFSALGFYPVDPLSGDYIVGTCVHDLFDMELEYLLD
jgi:putative alpha-1,2-mannosidase